MELEIEPEPAEAERAAIVAALDDETPPEAGPWRSEDDEP